MAKKLYEEENIRAIANRIREATGGNETYTTAEMPEGIAKVYLAGLEEGSSAGTNLANVYTDNGTRTNYDYAFAGNWWSDDKVTEFGFMTPTSANYMFANSGVSYVDPMMLDSSNCTSMDGMYYNNTSITTACIHAQSYQHLKDVFYGCSNLGTIHLSLKSDGSNTFSDDAFYGCTSLRIISIDGKIGNNIDLSSSTKLIDFEHIFRSLSSDVTNKVITLSRAAKEAAHPTYWYDGLEEEDPEWQIFMDYVVPSGWTVVLI